jgi:hypothetical protein
MRALLIDLFMLGAVALALVPLVACGDGGVRRDGHCQAPLSDYCEGSDCPTWDEAVADAEEFARENCAESKRAWVGLCGELRHVGRVTGIGTAAIQYFDDSGGLVAVQVQTDTPSYCRDTSFNLWYGQILDCELVQTQDLCEAQ